MPSVHYWTIHHNSSPKALPLTVGTSPGPAGYNQAMTITFIAPDIECAGCAASIQKALGRQPGVENVAVDVPTQTVTVHASDGAASRARIAAVLADIGFPEKTESAP